MKAVNKTATSSRKGKRNQQPSSGKSGGHPVGIQDGQRERQYQQQQKQQRPQQQQPQSPQPQYEQQQQQ